MVLMRRRWSCGFNIRCPKCPYFGPKICRSLLWQTTTRCRSTRYHIWSIEAFCGSVLLQVSNSELLSPFALGRIDWGMPLPLRSCSTHSMKDGEAVYQYCLGGPQPLSIQRTDDEASPTIFMRTIVWSTLVYALDSLRRMATQRPYSVV